MIFRQIIPTVLALFASLSVSAQTDTAAASSDTAKIPSKEEIEITDTYENSTKPVTAEPESEQADLHAGRRIMAGRRDRRGGQSLY